VTKPYALLLRAVNVGGARKLPMARWRDALAAAGLEDPRTYLNSGNAVVRSALSAPRLAAAVRSDLGEHLGIETDVIVRTAAQLAAVIAANPFPAALASEPRNLHVVFYADRIPAAAITALRHDAYAPDRISPDGAHAYIWYANGAGRSKIGSKGLPGFGIGTARNWNTVLALADMLGK
jgi:uncharacterized protein (DUF1697 family)